MESKFEKSYDEIEKVGNDILKIDEKNISVEELKNIYYTIQNTQKNYENSAKSQSDKMSELDEKIEYEKEFIEKRKFEGAGRKVEGKEINADVIKSHEEKLKEATAEKESILRNIEEENSKEYAIYLGKDKDGNSRYGRNVSKEEKDKMDKQMLDDLVHRAIVRENTVIGKTIDIKKSEIDKVQKDLNDERYSRMTFHSPLKVNEDGSPMISETKAYVIDEEKQKMMLDESNKKIAELEGKISALNKELKQLTELQKKCLENLKGYEEKMKQEVQGINDTIRRDVTVPNPSAPAQPTPSQPQPTPVQPQQTQPVPEQPEQTQPAPVQPQEAQSTQNSQQQTNSNLPPNIKFSQQKIYSEPNPASNDIQNKSKIVVSVNPETKKVTYKVENQNGKSFYFAADKKAIKRTRNKLKREGIQIGKDVIELDSKDVKNIDCELVDMMMKQGMEEETIEYVKTIQEGKNDLKSLNNVIQYDMKDANKLPFGMRLMYRKAAKNLKKNGLNVENIDDTKLWIEKAVGSVGKFLKNKTKSFSKKEEPKALDEPKTAKNNKREKFAKSVEYKNITPEQRKILERMEEEDKKRVAKEIQKIKAQKAGQTQSDGTQKAGQTQSDDEER